MAKDQPESKTVNKKTKTTAKKQEPKKVSTTKDTASRAKETKKESSSASKNIFAANIQTILGSVATIVVLGLGLILIWGLVNNQVDLGDRELRTGDTFSVEVPADWAEKAEENFTMYTDTEVIADADAGIYAGAGQLNFDLVEAYRLQFEDTQSIVDNLVESFTQENTNEQNIISFSEISDVEITLDEEGAITFQARVVGQVEGRPVQGEAEYTLSGESIGLVSVFAFDEDALDEDDAQAVIDSFNIVIDEPADSDVEAQPGAEPTTN